MLAVLSKQITEESVFKENLPKYEALLQDVFIIHEQIQLCRKAVIDKNNKFVSLKNQLIKPNEENNKVS